MRFGSVVRASSSVEGTRPRAAGSRRVYGQSQVSGPLSIAPVKQIANVVGPFAVLVALTFGMAVFFVFAILLCTLYLFTSSSAF